MVTALWCCVTLAGVATSLLRGWRVVWLWLFILSLFTGAAVLTFSGNGVQPAHLFLVFVVLLTWIDTCVKDKSFAVPSRPAVYLGLFALSGISSSVLLGVTNLGQFAYVLIGPFTAAVSSRVSRFIPRHTLVKTVLRVGLVVCLYGILETVLRGLGFSPNQYFAHFVNNPSVQNCTGAWFFGFPRTQSIFLEPSFFSVFAAIVALYGCGLRLEKKVVPGLSARFVALTILVATLGVGMTVSATGLFVFAVALVYLLLLGRSIRAVMAFAGLAVVCTIGFLFLGMFFPSVTQTWIDWVRLELTFRDASAQGRFADMLGGYSLLLAHPWSGVGIGRFVSADALSMVAATTGFPGLIFFVASFGSLILKTRARFRRAPETGTLPAAVTAFAIFAAYATGLGAYSLLWPWVFFGISDRLSGRMATDS